MYNDRNSDSGLITLLGNAIERRVRIDDTFFGRIFPGYYSDFKWQYGEPKIKYYLMFNRIDVSGVVISKLKSDYDLDRALERIEDEIYDYFEDIIDRVRCEYDDYDEEIDINVNITIIGDSY